MPLIPEETIVAVREATDIIALISRYVRDLKSAGKNYKGRCPFHDEKTPSFTANPERQTFRCFGCGEGGNAIHFLMKIEQIPFPEAVRQLANEAGVIIPENTDPEYSQRDELFQVNQWVADWFSYNLKSTAGEKPRKYLKERKISEEMITLFNIGYAPPGWDSLKKVSQEKNLPQDLMKKLGLYGEREGRIYDFYRDRLMFPITDVRGRIVGFGGRELDGSKVKYINSPESEIFHKSRNLYGLAQSARALRRDKQAVLVEGYTDVIMAHQYGFDVAVAALGTAMTKDHGRVLKRYVDKVILALDGDVAGQKAARRAIPILLSAGLEVKLALLPEGRDPCEFLLEEGAETFKNYLEQSSDVVDYYFSELKNPGPDEIHGVVKILGELISVVPSSILRELYQNKISELSGLKKESLNGILEAKNENKTEKTPLFGKNYSIPAKEEGDPVPLHELGVLSAMLHLPKKAQIIIDSLGPVELTHPLIIRMISLLYGHISGSPDTTPALCSAIFQEESEMALIVKCEEMAPSSHWKHFLDCLRKLKQEKLEMYDQLAQQASDAGDVEAKNEYLRKRYQLTKDLKGVTVQK